MRKPSIVSLVLAFIPFCGLCFSVPIWDRLNPHVLGLPFNMFWILAWVSATPVLMSIAFRIEKRR